MQMSAAGERAESVIYSPSAARCRTGARRPSGGMNQSVAADKQIEAKQCARISRVAHFGRAMPSLPRARRGYARAMTHARRRAGLYQ